MILIHSEQLLTTGQMAHVRALIGSMNLNLNTESCLQPQKRLIDRM